MTLGLFFKMKNYKKIAIAQKIAIASGVALLAMGCNNPTSQKHEDNLLEKGLETYTASTDIAPVEVCEKPTEGSVAEKLAEKPIVKYSNLSEKVEQPTGNIEFGTNFYEVEINGRRKMIPGTTISKSNSKFYIEFRQATPTEEDSMLISGGIEF